MGSRPSVVKESIVFTESSHIYSETKHNQRVIIQHDSPNVSKVTCFSKVPVRMTKTDRVNIRLNGAGVVRFGVTERNPMDNHDFFEEPLFEQEDGFESGLTERCLFVDPTMEVFCYGTIDDDYMEYSPNKEGGVNKPLYIYIMFIYGRPTVSATYRDETMEWNHPNISNISIDSSNCVTLNNLTNTTVIKLKDPMCVNQGYHIHWDMMLPQEKVGGKSPKYGYLRLGTATDDNPDWFAESAIMQYPYSGIIGVSATLQGLRHNVMVNSIGETNLVQGALFSVGKPPVYLVIEASLGDFMIERSPHYTARQYIGSAFLVKDHPEFENKMAARISMTAAVKYAPYHIQYGPDPMSFLVTFNKRFVNTDIIQLRKTFKNIQELPDTDTIQVVYKEGNLDRYAIEDAFSRRQQTGGSEILSLKEAPNTPKCWIIKYKEVEVARRVWMRQELKIDGVAVRILPWYDILGPAINSGEKPTFDDSDLVMKDLDQDKLMFVLKNEPERLRFEKQIRQGIPVTIEWSQPPGFEVDEDEPLSITITCNISKCSKSHRANWKEVISGQVISFLSTNIFSAKFDVENRQYDDTLKAVREIVQLSTSVCTHTGNRRKGEVQVISSSEDLIKTITRSIGMLNFKGENAASTVIPKRHMDSYFALDEEGLLDGVMRECPNTRVMVTSDGDIKISGPPGEVISADKTVQYLIVNTTVIQEHLSDGQKAVLKSKEGSACLEEKLKSEKLCSRFKIDGDFCKLCIHVAGKEDASKKGKRLQKCIDSVIVEKVVSLPKKDQLTLERKPIDNFVHQINTSGLPVYVEFDKQTQSIKILATIGNLDKAVDKLQNYLDDKPLITNKVVLALDVMEHLSSWCEQFQSDPYSVVMVKDDANEPDLPVAISIEATDDSMPKHKEMLQEAARNIKSHWFHISRPWLAVQRDEIADITKNLVHKFKCTFNIETAISLALKNISCVALEQKIGVTCLSICCDLTQSRVDAIVVPVESADLRLEAGLASAVGKAGGDSLKDECERYIRDNGSLPPDEAVRIGAGSLPSQTVVFVHTPKNEGNQGNPSIAALNACLKVVQNNYFSSVLIPAVAFCSTKNTDKNIDDVTKAIDAFVTKNQNGTIKEIGLCDMDPKKVELFQNSISTNLKKSWFVFCHGQKLKSILGDKDGQPIRPFSGTVRPRKGKDLVAWETVYRKHKVSGDDDEENEDRMIGKTSRMTEFSGGLPYTIEVTDSVVLSIMKGHIEEVNTDVVVNPTPTFPVIGGAISNALLKAGGKVIGDECKQLGTLNLDDVKMTNAGNLACKKLYHVIQPMEWNHETGPDVLTDIVSRCLNAANQQKVSSIAFPAIGTGASRFPADRVAEAMVKAVFDFTDKVVNPSLRDIQMIVFDKDSDTLKIFEDIIPDLIVSTAGNVAKSKTTLTDSRDALIERCMKKVQFLPSKRSVDHTPMDDIVFMKLTVLKNEMKAAVKECEDLVNRKFTTLNVKYDLEGGLTNDEIRLIENIESLHNVRVQIDHAKGTITLDGLKSHVDQAELRLMQLLKGDFLYERDVKKMREEIMKFVQWYYEEDDDLIPYDEVSNFDIHFAYLEQKNFVYHNQKENKRYQVLVDSHEEHPDDDSTKTRRMVQMQRISQGLAIPQTWTIYTSGDHRALVTLSPTSSEFSEVKQKFLADGCPANSIVNIIRIEDKFSYLQYMSKKKQLENQNPKGLQNERRLWHGTDSDTCDKIIKHGFNRSFAGKHATAYGVGAYFATTSSYSYGYTVAEAGVRRMLLTKVLTGEYCAGNPQLTILPTKATVKNMPIPYDSAVNNVRNPGMFVIFHDTQTYPEYLIEFT